MYGNYIVIKVIRYNSFPILFNSIIHLAFINKDKLHYANSRGKKQFVNMYYWFKLFYLAVLVQTEYSQGRLCCK